MLPFQRPCLRALKLERWTNAVFASPQLLNELPRAGLLQEERGISPGVMV